MNTACLLLHGFCGTPFEVQPLRAPLEALGCHVVSPTLPGHGTSLEDLKQTEYQDWVAFAEQEYMALRNTFNQVIVIGFSMGGSLALELGVRYRLDGLVTLSAPCRTYRLMPYEVRVPQALFLGLLRFISPYRPMRTAKPESKAIAPFQGYEGTFCAPQLYSMQKGYDILRKRLHTITCPALIMQDLHDRIVFPSNALEIAKSIKSQSITLRYTAAEEKITSHHHIVTNKKTTALVQDYVARFVSGLLKPEE